MAASLIKALTVLIVLQLVIIVAVLIIDIMILKNQNNAVDTTTNANPTSSFSTTTTEFNDTTITSTIDTNTSTLSSKPAIISPASSTASVPLSAIDTTTVTAVTTQSNNITKTSTIDTNTSSLSSKPAIVSPASSTASVPSSAIDNTTISTTTTTTISNTMTDCYDWLHVNKSTLNGIYQINPGYGLAPFDVYCDMTTDGGGWTVIQRQVNDSSEMWKNTWQQYKNGFNNSIENGSLWLGNDRIHVMSQSNVTLRVEINGEQFPNTNPNLYLYGKYNFSISDEMNNYTLYISLPIEGNASAAKPTHGFMRNNGKPFSTVDKSSNANGSVCANTYGAWWFNDGCTSVALNGEYNPSLLYNGFLWLNPTASIIRPMSSEMKIRRK